MSRPAPSSPNIVAGAVTLLIMGGLLVIRAVIASALEGGSVGTGAPARQASPSEPSPARAVPRVSDRFAEERPEPHVIEGAMLRPVRVGDVSYEVLSCWWSTRVNRLDLGSSESRFGEELSTPHLLVRVAVQNYGDRPADLPRFTLVDSAGRVYARASFGLAAKDGLGVFESLNPGVTKGGIIVFQANRGGTYRLVIPPVKGDDGVVEEGRILLSPD